MLRNCYRRSQFELIGLQVKGVHSPQQDHQCRKQNAIVFHLCLDLPGCLPNASNRSLQQSGSLLYSVDHTNRKVELTVQ